MNSSEAAAGKTRKKTKKLIFLEQRRGRQREVQAVSFVVSLSPLSFSLSLSIHRVLPRSAFFTASHRRSLAHSFLPFSCETKRAPRLGPSRERAFKVRRVEERAGRGERKSNSIAPFH